MTWLTRRPDREAHVISDYWDRLVRQQPALPVPPPDLPASQGALLRQLHAEEELARIPAYRDELLHRLLATYGETTSMTTTTAAALPQPSSGPRDSVSLHPRSRNAVSDVLAPHSGGSTGHVSVPAGRKERSTRSRLDRLATGAMALVLVVAIGGGAWLVSDRTPFGGGDDLPPNSMSGAVPEVTIEPGTSMSAIPYPDADCKGERPSRSWVIAHFEEGRRGYTVPGYYEVPIRPTVDERDAMLMTFSSWQACQFSHVPFAYSFVFETPRYTYTRGFVASFADGRPKDDELQRLASLALTRPHWVSESIDPAEIPATPVGTPIVHNQLPIPEGATPAIELVQKDRAGYLPVVFGDEIQIVAPGRAEAWVYWVNPETMEIRIGGSEAMRVRFEMIDGQWLIDDFGPSGMG